MWESIAVPRHADRANTKVVLGVVIQPSIVARTQFARGSLAHLLPELGKRLLVEIEASHVAKYQRARLAEGAANRTVNIEVSMLRQIMRKHGAWARIQSNVTMLPERQDVGRALSASTYPAAHHRKACGLVHWDSSEDERPLRSLRTR